MKWAAVLCAAKLLALLPYCSVARYRGLENVVVFLDLGFTPQALCLHLLRRLKADFVQSNCKAFSVKAH
jgi:hypothetical protein